MATILIIDDNQDVLDTTRDLLQLAGYSVIAARGGGEAFKQLELSLPDLILCDIRMPQMSGYEVLSQVRAQPQWLNIPFIFLTAKSSPAEKRLGMAMGVDDYLTKPFEYGDLLKAIDVRLKLKAKREQAQGHRLEQLRYSVTHSLPHELRTPLTTILGFSAILLDEYDITDRQAALEMLQIIYRSGERLQRLTESYLLYVQLESILSDPARMASLRQHCVSDSRHIINSLSREKATAYQRQEDLSLELADVQVAISQQDMKKMLEELLDNAFKFSPPKSPVAVQSWAQEGQFQLQISNQGRGIKEEYLHMIGAYMQFDRRTYEQTGLGFGLVIAKSIAQIFAGKLHIHSQAEGETRLMVTLPLATATEPT
jgi:two-component system, sensor histidine kinase and response regulator